MKDGKLHHECKTSLDFCWKTTYSLSTSWKTTSKIETLSENPLQFGKQHENQHEARWKTKTSLEPSLKIS